jgi:hypothetical protein
MLTAAQHQLAEAVDAMRANEATIVVLTRDLESTRAERNAYYAHLESAQATIAELREQLATLSRPPDCGPTGPQSASPASSLSEEARDTFPARCSAPAPASLSDASQPASTSAAGHDEATCVASHGAQAGSATSAQA